MHHRYLQSDRRLRHQPTPAITCKTAAKAILILKQNGGSGDKQLFKWVNGDALSQMTDLADPTDTTEYAVCLYKGSNDEELESFSVPAGAPNWSAIGDKGYKYKELTATNGGLTKLLLKGSLTAGKSTVVVKGKGTNLPDPTLANMQLPVTAQVINPDTGVCVEAVFHTQDVKKNISRQRDQQRNRIAQSQRSGARSTTRRRPC